MLLGFPKGFLSFLCTPSLPFPSLLPPRPPHTFLLFLLSHGPVFQHTALTWEESLSILTSGAEGKGDTGKGRASGRGHWHGWGERPLTQTSQALGGESCLGEGACGRRPCSYRVVLHDRLTLQQPHVQRETWPVAAALRGV